jgi:hypothetical protein
MPTRRVLVEASAAITRMERLHGLPRLGITSADGSDQHRRGILVQIAVRRDSAPMGEIGATTSATISELRGFTAIAHYYPVGGVS